MSLIHNPQDLSIQAQDFITAFAEAGPDFLEAHIPESFVVGIISGASVVERSRFIHMALQRAALVAGLRLAPPTISAVQVSEVGPGYLLATATWTMTLTNDEVATLVEDFLIDRTQPQWQCLAYLLRQDLPALLA
ncbi:MAG: hypothetical protein LBV06_03265 [Propionibacteriaceae bacterium]|jgi:hypothetical protein|nr:hypothetical protein [Propionibacteriaceae bacterium]